ncbi:uncharacterized protein LOC126377989 [Pectinophora gossypiella]|uniref:uncharacterized protein LOC126377989 n=1 Tax=Pectinophora gossypiella TaxID=13191 RepID=UPI00214EB0AE|nr:uncharacterized protein LOC126377989 [Pectinophora gossypiella]
MWHLFTLAVLLPISLSRNFKRNDEITSSSIFKVEQIVFSSNFNITRIYVPVDGKYVHSNDIPSIFFTVSDPKLDGGSCVYVLEGFAAYEILEGGRDTTAGYGVDRSVYIGAKDGMYRYDPDTLSAKRYGIFKDNIMLIQKANGTEAFYILTNENKLFKLENNGTVKTRIVPVDCAKDFVVDTSNNIYYIPCTDHLPKIVQANGTVLAINVFEDLRDIKLLRPAFVMEDCIPFFGDGWLYLLYSNGTGHRKDFAIKERPSAYSVDAALYLVAALNGKIYEFNVMEVLLKSMFGMINEWPRDVSKMVLSMMETAKETVYSYYV